MTTTIQIPVDLAKKLKELFPGTTYEQAITQILNPEGSFVLSEDLFRMAEWAGWARSWWPQLRVTLAAGETTELTYFVPEREVWFGISAVFGDCLSNSILFTMEKHYRDPSDKELVNKVSFLLTEGLVGADVPAAVFHQISDYITWSLENITGNSAYTSLPAQTVTIDATVKYFVVYKPWHTLMQKLILVNARKVQKQLQLAGELPGWVKL